MTEPGRPRLMDVYPLVAEQPDHGRAHFLCTCSGLTDLTWKLDMPPSSVTCAGCGTELELELPRG